MNLEVALLHSSIQMSAGHLSVGALAFWACVREYTSFDRLYHLVANKTQMMCLPHPPNLNGLPTGKG